MIPPGPAPDLNRAGLREAFLAVDSSPETATLALQLFPQPRPIQVRSRARRDHTLPVSFRHGSEWRAVTAAGPHRVSCGHEEGAQAREYFRCVTEVGEMLWIYHDAVEGKWFLHGWWD
jgi:hypothetical protein